MKTPYTLLLKPQDGKIFYFKEVTSIVNGKGDGTTFLYRNPFSFSVVENRRFPPYFKPPYFGKTHHSFLRSGTISPLPSPLTELVTVIRIRRCLFKLNCIHLDLIRYRKIKISLLARKVQRKILLLNDIRFLYNNNKEIVSST